MLAKHSIEVGISITDSDRQRGSCEEVRQIGKNINSFRRLCSISEGTEC